VIIITPEAAEELRALARNGGPNVLKFEAQEERDGAYQCSVSLVSGVPEGADVEDIDGVTVAYTGMAESVFAGARVGLSLQGELTLEMAEAGCEHCGHGDNCGTDGCGSEGGCCE